MPTLLVALAIGLVGWLAWRGARKEISRVNDDLHRKKSDTPPADKGTTLTQDPKTGIYRPEEDGE